MRRGGLEKDETQNFTRDHFFDLEEIAIFHDALPLGFLTVMNTTLTSSKMLNAGIPFKAYGCRTMVANWWEERINLEAHLPRARGITQPTRELDVDTHVMACETSPKWRQDHPSVTMSTYSDMTDQAWLDEKSRLVHRRQTADQRRRLEGTMAMRGVKVPGSTVTREWLSRQFHEPHKTRFKTVYMRDDCHPELEATIASCARRAVSDAPRRRWTQGTWIPGWRASKHKPDHRARFLVHLL